MNKNGGPTFLGMELAPGDKTPTKAISSIISLVEKILSEDNESKIAVLSKRWCILKMLASENYTQREVAKKLHVSLCKITRGAKILNTSNSITKKIINGEKNDKKYTAIN